MAACAGPCFVTAADLFISNSAHEDFRGREVKLHGRDAPLSDITTSQAPAAPPSSHLQAPVLFTSCACRKQAREQQNNWDMNISRWPLHKERKLRQQPGP
jgi:hypothetical protein